MCAVRIDLIQPPGGFHNRQSIKVLTRKPSVVRIFESLKGPGSDAPRFFARSLRLGHSRYLLSRGGVNVLAVGVEPPGASGLAGAGAFFGFFASLLPR